LLTEGDINGARDSRSLFKELGGSEREVAVIGGNGDVIAL
jgi:hypothetical protein